MKRKLFTFLMAFLAIAGNAVWGQGLGKPDSYYDISDYGKVLVIEDSEDYYLTGSNNYGILVKAGGSSVTIGGDKRNKPHIYLKDVSFGSVDQPMGGSAIIIENRTVVSITIDGENSIVSNGTADAAIKLETGEGFNTAELIFNGTGILDINMLGTEAINQVAIGERGAGIDAMHNCGTLYINGGTIITNGYIGEFDSHSFNMEGNGIVIAKDIVTSEIHENWLVDDGIYYETEEEGQNALNVVGNVTIKSPIPEGYPLYIGEGSSLTLGEGDALEADKVTISGGTLNAYEVSYTSNTASGVTVSPETISTKYMGKNTPLDKFSSISPETLYSFWGWMYNNSEFVSTTPNTDPSNKQEYKVNGVWVLKNYTGEEVEKGTEIENISLIYPGMAASLFAVTEDSENKLPDALSLSNGSISGTLNASGTAKYTITQGSKTQEATLTFKVKDDGQGGDETTDISTAGYKLNIAELTYNGQEQDVPVTVEDNEGNKLTAGTDYTVTPAKVKDVQEGGYSISVEGTGKYTGKLTGTLIVKPATLKATVDPITVELNGDQPDFDNAKITYEEGAKPFGDDDVTIDLGELTINTSISGEQEYTFKLASLTGSDAGNYVLEGSVTVKIIVGEGEQGGDDEDKTDLASQVSISIKDEGKIFVYNGDVQEQDATRLVIVENKETGDIYEENVDFKVEIGHGNTSNFEEAPFKLAGNYSIRIVPIESEDSNLKGESQVLENVLTIYPRKVAVKANPLYYTIGKEDEVNLKDVIVEIEDENIGICEEDKGFVSIRLVNNPQLSEAYKEPGIYTFTYKVELLNASPNYTITNDGEVDGLIYVMKNITDEDPMNPGSMEEGNDSDISLQEGWEYVNENIYKRLYDGLKHPLHTIYVKVMKDNEPTWVALQEEREEFSISGVEGEIKNAGHYNLEITLNGEKNKLYDGKVKITLVIIPAQLSVDLNLPVEVKSDDDLASIWSAEDAIIEGEVNNEEGKIEGTLSEVKREGNIMTVTVDGLALKENGAFLPGNYEPIYKNHGTEVTIDEVTGKPYVELKIEDAKAEDLKPGEGEGWTEINGTYTRVYDGKEHPLTSITVDGVSMTEGFTVDYNGADKVKDAGTYLATVTFTDGKYAPTTMVLTIQQRPMEITFDLPETIKEGETLDIHALIRYQQMGEDCGLIEAEGEPVIKSGQLVVTAPYDNGKCAVILKDFLLEKNESGFNPANYGLKVWDATIKDWAAYENDGNDPDITLTDPTNPDEENPNGEGGSGITVDDGDDDNPDNPGTDPDDPTTDPDKPINPNPGDKPSIDRPSYSPYKHFYVYIEEVCDGIELWTKSGVVREGNQVSIYMEIAEGCDTTGMKLEYKRGLFGTWDDLKLLEGVQPGEYIIKHIYTDIYVRATGAKMDGSATGIEDLGDAQTKVYTQDGRIYVYAPERADVQIVNMAGVVVQRSEQIGLQAYDRLNPGIYIVRVGDEVFKVKL